MGATQMVAVSAGAMTTPAATAEVVSTSSEGATAAEMDQLLREVLALSPDWSALIKGWGGTRFPWSHGGAMY